MNVFRGRDSREGGAATPAGRRPSCSSVCACLFSLSISFSERMWGWNMTTFRWLHLTDLHQGMSAQQWLLPQVVDDFYRDLTSLHRKCGPWDLVLFTGDLTQHGSAEQFQRLDRTLGDLRDKLAELGSYPVLLAVPGNHDLVRPRDRDDPSVAPLLHWPEAPYIHDSFWTKPESAYRIAVRDAFAEYSDWWSRAGHGFKRPEQMKHGMLPGDFSAIVEKDGHLLGVLGLNTAFLHLADVCPGHLALHTSQFHAACDGDGIAWARRCDAALLLTHHPPDWLDPRSRDEHLFEKIAPPGRFAAHLFGHMHDGAVSTIGHGGAEPRRFWQGMSLFGLEAWGGSGNAEQRRAHGYAAGQIELGREASALRLWPRKAVQTQARTWRISGDTSFELDDDGGTRPEAVMRLRPAPRREAPAPPDNPSWLPQPPGGAYDAAWYVARGWEEKMVLSQLPHPGCPAIVIWGPLAHGKTTFVRHVLSRLPDVLQGPPPRIVQVKLSTFGDAIRTETSFFRTLGARIARGAGRLQPGEALAPWPDSPSDHLSDLMVDILRSEKRSFVLVIEQLDALLEFEFRETVLEVFRHWVQLVEEPWPAFRLVVAVTRTPMSLIRKLTRSPFFNSATQIEIGPLDEGATRQLMRLYRLTLTDEQLKNLREAVGGHPFLLREAMYQAAHRGVPLERVLDRGSPAGKALRERAVAILPQLSGPLHAALCEVLANPRKTLPVEVYEALRGAGLLDHTGGMYRFRCKLYEEHFSTLCNAK
ncbi:AAA-like domain-containing protein [Sorangium sp. So ce341]|uniref:AAA-like domain-containing protein n=1 Tax=Sorangium sp. So ce341 TaxID=3133302 RepID=UPI003F5E94BC